MLDVAGMFIKAAEQLRKVGEVRTTAGREGPIMAPPRRFNYYPLKQTYLGYQMASR